MHGGIAGNSRKSAYFPHIILYSICPDLGPGPREIVHPVHLVQDLFELEPDVVDHLHHGLLGGLLEVFGHVHRADRGGE